MQPAKSNAAVTLSSRSRNSLCISMIAFVELEAAIRAGGELPGHVAR